MGWCAAALPTKRTRPPRCTRTARGELLVERLSRGRCAEVAPARWARWSGAVVAGRESVRHRARRRALRWPAHWTGPSGNTDCIPCKRASRVMRPHRRVLGGHRQRRSGARCAGSAGAHQLLRCGRVRLCWPAPPVLAAPARATTQRVWEMGAASANYTIGTAPRGTHQRSDAVTAKRYAGLLPA
jgi:hypothetical protein